MIGTPAPPMVTSVAVVPLIRRDRALSGYSGFCFLANCAGIGFMQPIRGETPAGCAKVSGGNWALVVSSLMFTLAIVLPSLTKLRARGKTFPPIGCQSVSVLDEGSRTRLPRSEEQ